MKRRLNNEGSVAYDKKRDRWVARARVRDEQGEHTRLYFYGKSSAEAINKMRAAQNRISEGKPPVDGRLTVAAWLNEWSAGPLDVSPR